MASAAITVAGVWAVQEKAVSSTYPFLMLLKVELMSICVAPDALKDPKNPFGKPAMNWESECQVHGYWRLYLKLPPRLSRTLTRWGSYDDAVKLKNYYVLELCYISRTYGSQKRIVCRLEDKTLIYGMVVSTCASLLRRPSGIISTSIHDLFCVNRPLQPSQARNTYQLLQLELCHIILHNALSSCILSLKSDLILSAPFH